MMRGLFGSGCMAGLLGFALGASGIHALTYSWRPSAGSYVSGAGDTLTFPSADNAVAFVSLPFNFTYDSLVYSSLWASTNGLVGFGTSSSSSNNSSLYSTISPYSILAPWWDDLIDDATATVQTFTEGASPNRVFVIQYGDYPDWVSVSTLRLQYQVRLYEGTNRIQFSYGASSAGSPHTFSSASIGIKGRNTLPGFFIDGATGSRTAGLSNLTSATGFPSAGSVFTFAPDTVAPAGLTGSPGNGLVDLVWRRSRLTTLMRYRIYVGASPTTMVLRDSTATLTDTTLALTGLANGTTYYVGVTGVGPGLVESGFAQVVAVIPTQLPSVSITSPASGTIYHSTASVPFTAAASDPDGTISRVEYYRGTILIGSSTFGSAYSVTWSFPVAGTHTVTAKAFDNSGASTTSAPITITVNSPPSVFLTGPASGILVAPGSPVNLTATATDGDGAITVVEFLLNGVKIGEDATSPYAYAWTAGPSGYHTITARAIDNSGEGRVSSSRSITVDLPPQVDITSPATGTLVDPGSPVTLSAVATDADGTVGRVDFYRGTILLGSSYAGSPFNFTWSSAIAGVQVITARAFDNLGIADTSASITLLVNAPPTVSLTAPAHFSAFPTSGAIALTAAASDSTGAVAEVRFYRDSILIGSSASGPAYPVTWSNAAPGRYRLQARAVDERGLIGYSQAVTVFVNDSAKSILGGRLFITGHDADNHGNLDFTSAGLDYLFFGKAAGTNDQPYRLGARIAFLGNLPALQSAILSYPQPVFIDLDLPRWDTLAFPSRPFDAIIVGTGLDYITSAGSTSLNAQKAKFESYFNNGGGIFVMSEQGIGQTFYNFLPSFALARQQNIGSVDGVFTATQAGLAIGLTESIVDRDLTHTEFFDVDTTLFRIFEFYNPDGQPVTIGANAIIEGDVFVPQDSVVADPQAFSRDSVFLDTLCIRFESPTPGAAIHLTRDGGNPDTSTWVIANGSSVCIDNSATFRVVAKKTGWIRSNETVFSFRRADQVAVPAPSIPGSYFRDSLCVRFTSTPGSSVHYTLDGGRPDSSSLSIPSGDSVCIDASAVIRVIGKKAGMRDSDTASHAYTRMQKVAMPVADAADSTYFRDSLCFGLSTATPGAHIRYTLDGGAPDTAETHVHNGDSLCVDRSTTVRFMAELPNWIESDGNAARFLRMDTAAAPVSDKADSTYFLDSLCIRLSSATPGAVIHFTLDGTGPDTLSPSLAGGDSICFDRGLTVKAMAVKENMVESPVSTFQYPEIAPRASKPVPSRPDSTWFRDTLCVRFTSATDSAVIHYLIGGGNPDTSSLTLTPEQDVCVDRNSVVSAVAKRPGWETSEALAVRYFKMDTVAAPTAAPGDSAYFDGRLCVRLSSATSGASIRFTLDGGEPDTSGRSLSSGDTVCLDGTATLRALGRRADWVDSRKTTFTYIRMQAVEKPVADKADSTYFADSICVRFTAPTPGSALHFVLDGGSPDTSSAILPSGQPLCVDRSANIQVVAMKPNWLTSPETQVHVLRMDTVATPRADWPDSTHFATRLCVRLSSATAGSVIHYTLDGGNPDSSASFLANGDSICLEDTVTLRLLARKPDWIPSREAAFDYIRMQQVAKPAADMADSTYFPDSLCVRFSTATPGADLRYTVDGSAPDSTSPVLAGGGPLCLDRSGLIRVVGTRNRWIPSEETALSLLKMDTVARPEPSLPDSTYFERSLCMKWNVATPGAVIRYTLDGGSPDSSALTLADGDSLCLDRTTTMRAVGTKRNAINSDEIAATYIRMRQAARPVADKANLLYFPDSLCIRWSSSTEGARIHYTLDGGEADTSGLSIANGDSLCVDRSMQVRATAQLKNWIPSEESVLSVFRMETVSAPKSDKPDSTWFEKSLCVEWTTATAGASIRLAGTLPDSTGRVLASGDSVCLDRSATLRAVASLENWKNSPEVSRVYLKMDTVARPVFDRGDTVFYPSVCIRVSSATPGASLQYTLDGGNPDTSGLSKSGNDTICVDRSAEIRVIGKRKNSVPSEVSVLRLDRMPQVAPLKPSIGDSAVFARRICFTLVSATDSVRIRYALDGGDPLESGLSVAGGDSICLDGSAEFVAVGMRPLWRNSEEVRISLEVDNEGPAILKAEKRPYNLHNISVSGNCRGIGQDTLVITLSERLFPKSKPPRWDRLLLFSSSCESGSAFQVPVSGMPVISKDGLEATLILDNNSKEETPKLGNCLSLDWKAGEFEDRVGNKPARKGVRIEGHETAVRISQLRAYPPVVGLDDARGASGGCLDETVDVNTWIPPVGFDPGKGLIDAREVQSCSQGRRPPETEGTRTALPPCMAIVEVISDGGYLADVGIFDHLGNFVSNSRQQFGACGELDNLDRSVAGKKRSYLVWNVRDSHGTRVGNGVYVWRIRFSAEKQGQKSAQTVLVRTGFLRNASCGE